LASTARRLARLEAGAGELTPKQRFKLAVHALHHEGHFDPSIKKGMNELQIREFGQYVDFLYCVEHQIGPMVFVIESTASALVAEADRLAFTFESWQRTLEETWPHAAEVADSFLRLRREIETGKREGFAGILADTKKLLGEAAAIESIWADVALEFDGADLISPETRARLNRGKAYLKDLQERLGYKASGLKPDEVFLDGLTKLVTLAHDFRSYGRQ
jgi:hypothetical protein